MIRVEGLVKRFGDVRAIDDISFEARAGQITGFLGPNGAGKTTTMRILSTLIRADAGTATVEGYDVVSQAEEVRRSIGLLTEEPGLYDRMTVREQLSFFASTYDIGTGAAARTIALLARRLGFEEYLDRRAGTLSKGNRQKVAVARALLHDPPVLLLDEPTAALDVVAANAMEEFMASDALRGKTVLLSTHIVEEAARLCSRIIVVARGRVVAHGTPDDLAGGDDLRRALIRLMGEPASDGVSR
jgi:sodium transport system ATP-binding protein